MEKNILIEEKEKKNKCNIIEMVKPILVTMEDIPQINFLIISFWGKKDIYSNYFYFEILKKSLSYCYKLNKELIAVCLTNEDISKNEIEITLLCVKKEYHHCGLGKNLLKFCIDNCIKKGYYKFRLHVSTTNEVALKLYKSLGFKRDTFIQKYYRNDKPPNQDAFLMKLDINKSKGFRNIENNNNFKVVKQKRLYNNINCLCE